MATSTSDSRDWLLLGVLTAPWGLRGEIKVRLETDYSLLRQVKRVYLGDERRVCTVDGVYRRGRAYTLKLHGVGSVEGAEELRNLPIAIPHDEAPPLPAGHFFVKDIVGLRAVTIAGRDLGVVADVLPTRANDVYVVRGPAGEVLIPALKNVVTIDLPAGLITVDPIPGLLDE